ncbi:RNA polymerase sigma factor, partial [Daejeonella sp.]|uniref:RNA polymerase sigma factor n=1 Tax=Daejeonella sp. TaxID=2805397 RepID=UPI0037C12FA8
MRDDKSDIDLISQVLQGDRMAYAEIIKKHQRFVFTLALRFSKCREDAEEIAQDSFIKAFRALATFKQNAKFSTWLYSIVYTTAMTFLRKKKLDTQSIDDETSLIQLEAYSSDHTVIDVEHKSKMQFVNLAIS